MKVTLEDMNRIILLAEVHWKRWEWLACPDLTRVPGKQLLSILNTESPLDKTEVQDKAAGFVR